MDRKSALKTFAKYDEVVNLTKDCENKCKECSLYDSTCGKCLVPEEIMKLDENNYCLAGDKRKVFNKVRLFGAREQFRKNVKNNDEHGLAGSVWSWIVRMLSTGNGAYFLRDSIRMMKEYHSTKKDNVKAELRQNIFNLGPDFYQLQVSREWQPNIQLLWWLLVEDQYKLRQKNGKI